MFCNPCYKKLKRKQASCKRSLQRGVSFREAYPAYADHGPAQQKWCEQEMLQWLTTHPNR